MKVIGNFLVSAVLLSNLETLQNVLSECVSEIQIGTLKPMLNGTRNACIFRHLQWNG